MTLSLKQIIILPIVGLIALFSFLVLISKSCNRQPEEPIYTKLARMGGGINMGDTTKPQVKPVNHIYILQGDEGKFNLLWTFLNSPIDVTPRQLDSLKFWIQRDLKIDTTNLK